MQWVCSPYAGRVSSVKSLTQGHLCPAQSPKGNLRTVIVTEVLEGEKSVLRKTNSVLLLPASELCLVEGHTY